jgi:hypothetical protein
MRIAPLVLVALVSTMAGEAHAGDAATAETLFNEARRLMQEGSYASACPLLEESQRLDPGIGTQFNLADCYEHEGRTASAWMLFLDVAAATKAAGQTAREEAARDRASSLAGRLARLTITVPEKHPRELEVRRDGTLVRAVLWGVPVPVDPGSHSVQVTAPGRRPWRTKLEIGSEATTTALAVPDLEPLGDETSGGVAVASPESEKAPAHDEGSSSWGTQRVLAAGLFGAGVIGLLVGTGYGIDAIVKHSDSSAGCPNNTSCTAAAGAVRDEAIHSGNASTAAFTIGLAAVGGAAILWLTAPSSSPAHATPSLASGSREATAKSVGLTLLPGGASLSGAF